MQNQFHGPSSLKLWYLIIVTRFFANVKVPGSFREESDFCYIPVRYFGRTAHFPKAAIFAGYHFWNHWVKIPINAGKIEFTAPIHPPIPVPMRK